MGYWLFMLAVFLLIPLTMIIFGRHFMSNPPKDINSFYGYRTSMSMKSRETWDFAHRYFGKLWFILGLVLLPLSVIPMFFLLGKSVETIGNAQPCYHGNPAAFSRRSHYSHGGGPEKELRPIRFPPLRAE